MVQRRLGKLYPKIEGDSRYGFKYISLIKTDTEFAASAGLSGAAQEGQVRYDETDDQLKLWNGSAEVSVVAASAAGTGLDGNYDINKTITIDAGAVVLTGSSTDDHLQITTSGALASDKALIDLVPTGTVDAGSSAIRFDYSGATSSGNPYAMELVATGKEVGFAYIDSDPDATHQIYLHTDGDMGAGMAQLYIDNDGTPNATGTLLTLDATGTTATNTAYAMSIDSSGVDAAALTIDSDAATDSVVLIHGGGALASNKALLELTSDGTPANAGSNMLRVDGTGADNTIKPVLVEILDDSVATGLSVITSPTGNDAVIIAGDGAMTDGNAALAVSGSGDIAAGGIVCELILDGSSPDTDARVLEVMAGGKDVVGLYMDTASATNDGVYILNDGALAAGKAAVHIDLNGDINATANALYVESTGATATSTAYLVKFDTSSKDSGALYVDSDAATDHAVHIHGGGNLADNKAILNLSSDGTPATGTANFLRIDASGADTSNVPTGIEIVGAGETMCGIYSDTDGTSAHQNLFHGGGALTNGLGVVGITNDGNLAAGGNLLNITMGGTPANSTACALEIVAAKDCQAMAIATSAATQSGVLITGSGATANNTAVFEVNWGASTPANAGSNLVRIDGSGATNTTKPVLLEVYDDSVAVGLSVSTASVEDMVTFIGTGATGSAKAVVDITSTAVLNAAGNLLRVDATGADTTSVPNLIEVVGTGETARGLYIDTDGTSKGAALFHSGGALTNGIGVVMVTNDGNLAAGGNLLNMTMGGTPANATVVGMELVVAKDCLAASIESSAATTHGVQIVGVGALADNKALLSLQHGTGTLANGSAILRIESTTAATATAYGMEIACNAANLEALNVTAGKVVMAETLDVTGVITATAQIDASGDGIQTKLGTTADLTATPTDGELSTAFGVENKTIGGFIGVVEDSGSNVCHIVVSDGTTWHFVACTAAGA